jgi:hypothetical protein
LPDVDVDVVVVVDLDEADHLLAHAYLVDEADLVAQEYLVDMVHLVDLVAGHEAPRPLEVVEVEEE